MGRRNLEMKFGWIILALGTLVLPGRAQLLSFPGASGYGAYATGGRGGDVYTVTNLNGSGTGSLAQGLATVPTAGRTIVFAVSGYIPVPSSALRLTASKVTIAGQTAPGDGVGLRNGTFRISGDDVIVRHLRLRHGKNGAGGDCLNLDSGSARAMLDHLSMTFSTDENFSSFGSPPEDLTLQWSLNSWGLESHSCGGLWDQNHATCHHTLWAHNHTRNPKARPNGLLEWINNVTYDWDIGFIMGDSQTPATWKANVIGNYFLSPPGNLRTRALEKANLDRNGNPNFSIHVAGNLHDADGDGLLNGTDKGYGIASGSYTTLATPAANTGSVPVAQDGALLAFKKVLSQAGPLRLNAGYAGPVRDEVDTRMIQNVLTQTRNHITRESDLAGISGAGFGTLNSTTAPIDSDRDGMPDFYEMALGWNAAAADHNTVVSGASFFPAGTPAGYTRLEEYLHFLAVPHAVVVRNVPVDPDIDLARYTLGFVNAPVFTVSGVTGGTVVQSGAGGRLVDFSPALNFAGRAGFAFTVTDAQGSAWTQSFAIVVTATGLPRSLTWQGDGAVNAWDAVASNWRQDAAALAFAPGDRVTFGESGSRLPAVNLTGVLQPGTVDVNATGSYQLGGSGSISTTGTLTKRGSGDLTVAVPVAASGGVVLESGRLLLSGTGGWTGGPLTLGDETAVVNASDAGTQREISNPLVVPAGAVASTRLGNRMVLSGGLSGSGTWQAVVQTSVNRNDLKGPTAGFAGQLNFTGSGGVRLFFNGGTFNGFDAAQVDVAGSVSLQPQTNSGGNTFNIGKLSGESATAILAGGTAGAVSYVVGGLNRDSSYAGGFSGNANLTKTGSGTLVLTGAASHTGTTLVSGGALAVQGTLGGSTLTVGAAGVLSGTGTVSSPVAVQAGGTISPGPGSGGVGTLTLGGGLGLTSPVLPFDLSSNPAAGNDRIQLTGGTLAMSGAQTFRFRLTDDVLGAGTYPLISGATNSSASGITLAHNLPSGSRQTFALERAAAGANPSYIQLVVGGSPATLTWTGAVNNLWDTGTANWSGATPNRFYPYDMVSFNDSSAVGSVTLGGSLAPRQITLTGTRAWSWNGSGVLSGSGGIAKSGSGTLTINPAMISVSGTTVADSSQVTVTDAAGLGVGMEVFGGGFAAGTTITGIAGNVLTLSGTTATAGTATLGFEARHRMSGTTTIGSGGGIVLANAAANAAGLGTGMVSFDGGVLTVAGHHGSSGVSTGVFPNAIEVPTTRTGTILAPQRGGLSGPWLGGGTLNLVVKYVRGDFYGNMSGFTGRVNATAAGTGAEFRLATNYAPSGFPNAAVSLGAGVNLKHSGILSGGTGTSVPIGELSGASGAMVQGGVTGGRALTYVIGGKGTSSTFAGTISEQTAFTLTNFTKIGIGTWTLSGTGTWAGGTQVQQGALCIAGTMSSAGAVQVADGASLCLQGGSLTTDAVNLNGTATLSGYGLLEADLNVGTGATVTVSSGTLAVSGDLVNDGVIRCTGSGSLLSTGNFVNNGVLDLLTGSASLPPSFENNGVVIDRQGLELTAYGKSGNSFSLSLRTYAGHSYQLQSSAALAAGWSNLGVALAGDGTVRTFTDPSGAASGRRYYRIVVTP